MDIADEEAKTGEKWSDFLPRHGKEKPITIIHFNDVYNIEMDGDEMGGVARFINAVQSHAEKNPLILFSGDAFNPSWLSAHTNGWHMVPFLNMLKIHTACFGNHDFDFGTDNLEYLAGSTTFPWLMSNVKSAATGEPLANGVVYRIFEWQHVRVGIMALVEKEWIDTLTDVSPEDVLYIDFVEEANRLSRLMRTKKVELIIALTHMRAPNDERLAYEAEDLDLILGGHDHEYFGAQQLGRCVVVKSGTDFREFTCMQIHPENTGGGDGEEGGVMKDIYCRTKLHPCDDQSGTVYLPRFRNGSKVTWKRIEVNKRYSINTHVQALVEHYESKVKVEVDRVIAEVATPLEARFKYIRTEECNLGNWIADIVRNELRADIVFINSGTIRTDAVIEAGNFTVRDLLNMLPMEDAMVVLSVTGEQIFEVLENSVSKYPKMEGRFLQISGMKFAFNPDNECGNRVIRESVYVLENDGSHVPIVKQKAYTVGTKSYLNDGKDGYDIFLKCPTIHDEEATVPLSTMIQKVCLMADAVKCADQSVQRSGVKRLNSFREVDTTTHKNIYGFEFIDGCYKISPSVVGRITIQR